MTTRRARGHGRARSPRPRRACGTPRGFPPSLSCPRRSGRAGRRPHPLRCRNQFRAAPRTRRTTSAGRGRGSRSQLEEVDAGGRKRRLRTAAQRCRDLPAVGLMPDHDDRLAAARDGRTNVLRRGAGCELVTRLRGAEPQIDSRLSCSEQRGRKHRIRLDSVGAELLPEATGLLVALGREGAQLGFITTRTEELGPFGQRFFRAGHAHAGVLLVLSLVYFLYLPRAEYSNGVEWLAGGILVAGILGQSGGFFIHLWRGHEGESSVGTTVTRLGGGLLAAALLILAVGLIKTA